MQIVRNARASALALASCQEQLNVYQTFRFLFQFMIWMFMLFMKLKKSRIELLKEIYLPTDKDHVRERIRARCF